MAQIKYATPKLVKFSDIAYGECGTDPCVTFGCGAISYCDEGCHPATSSRPTVKA